MSGKGSSGPNEVPGWTIKVMEELAAFIGARQHRGAAAKAGELTFFQTGMLASLKKIADGDGEPGDQKKLMQQLVSTEIEVNEIMQELRKTRDKLAGKAGSVDFAHAIDKIVDGSFGKCSIRDRIGEVIRTKIDEPYLPALARQVCNEIEMFNKAVSDLNRRAMNWGKE
jgi:hypothetical protein